MIIDTTEALMAKVKDAKLLLSKDADDAVALLSKATDDAKMLLDEAAETVGVTEAAKVVLYKAAEDAEALLNKATEGAEALLNEAAETAEALLARVKQLEGIIPICAYCKKIRDDEDSWQQLEQYLSEHSGAWFSHGICPDCAEEQMGEACSLWHQRRRPFV